MTPRARGEFVIALVADLLGAAAALLVCGRAWQTVLAPRQRPLADDILHVRGRTLEPAVAALAIVALVGVLAVLATKGVVRRVVGALIAVVGVGLVWRASAGLHAVTDDRARSLVTSAHTGVGLVPGRAISVSVQDVWPVLVLVSGLLVTAAGMLVAARGHTWTGLSSRYDAPTAGAKAEQERSDIGMWNALDRGDDPTAAGTEPPSRTES